MIHPNKPTVYVQKCDLNHSTVLIMRGLGYEIEPDASVTAGTIRAVLNQNVKIVDLKTGEITKGT